MPKEPRQVQTSVIFHINNHGNVNTVARAALTLTPWTVQQLIVCTLGAVALPKEPRQAQLYFIYVINNHGNVNTVARAALTLTPWAAQQHTDCALGAVALPKEVISFCHQQSWQCKYRSKSCTYIDSFDSSKTYRLCPRYCGIAQGAKVSTTFCHFCHQQSWQCK